MIHRDLKPGNVMLDERGHVKIVDFGLSRVLAPDDPSLDSGLTVSGQIVGTPHYMAPEQMCGEEIDTRSDIFALGVILFELATGQRPFRGDSYPVLMRSVMADDPPSCTAIVPRFDPELERCLRKALEKDPAVRYQTAADLGADLRRLRRGSDTQHGLSKTRRPVRRPRIVVAVVALLAGVAASLWGAGVFEAQRTLVAVLPFVAASAADSQPAEDLGDGVRRELGRSSPDRLLVMGRFSSLRPELQEADGRVVCERLGVQFAVRGKVRAQEGGGRLVRVWLEDGSGVEVFSKDFAVSDDLPGACRDITKRLCRKLGVAGASRGRLPRAVDPRAHELYVQGRRLMYTTIGEDSEALRSFRRAIEIDDRFALAHAAAARELIWVMSWNLSVRLGEPAKRHAQQAVDIDPELAESQSAMALVEFLVDWDLDTAEARFERAIGQFPSNGDLYHWYGHLKGVRGDQKAAIRLFREGLRLDPLAHFHHCCMALHQVLDDDLADAEQSIAESLKLFPGWPLAFQNRGMLLERSGRLDDAVVEWRKMKEARETPGARSLVAYGLGLAGKKEQARKILEDLRTTAAQGRFVGHMEFARIHVGLGEYDTAFAELERARARHEPWMICLPISAGFEPIRQREEYRALLRRLGVTK